MMAAILDQHYVKVKYLPALVRILFKRGVAPPRSEVFTRAIAFPIRGVGESQMALYSALYDIILLDFIYTPS